MLVYQQGLKGLYSIFMTWIDLSLSVSHAFLCQAHSWYTAHNHSRTVQLQQYPPPPTNTHISIGSSLSLWHSSLIPLSLTSSLCGLATTPHWVCWTCPLPQSINISACPLSLGDPPLQPRGRPKVLREIERRREMKGERKQPHYRGERIDERDGSTVIFWKPCHIVTLLFAPQSMIKWKVNLQREWEKGTDM